MAKKIAAHLVSFVRKSSSTPVTNNTINPYVINKNPRNLERLRLIKQPCGYPIDDKDVEYFHKLNIVQGLKYVTAQLLFNNYTFDEVVLEASTKEWAIRKFLYSGDDKQAYIILAKVFADRCIESGLTSFKSCKYVENENSNVWAFVKTLKEEGLLLEELPYFDIHDIWARKREKRPWTVLED